MASGSLACLLELLLSHSLQSSDQQLERERAIAQQKCGVCHAIATEDQPPHAIVVPFRELHTLDPIDMLMEARSSGTIAGHDEMSSFPLSQDDMGALLSYIDSFAPPKQLTLTPESSKPARKRPKKSAAPQANPPKKAASRKRSSTRPR